MFTEARFGAGAVEQVLAALPPTDRAVLREVSSVGWCPVEPVLAYHRRLDQQFGNGNLDVCVEAGRFSAGWALNTILKLYLKLKSPHWLTE